MNEIVAGYRFIRRLLIADAQLAAAIALRVYPTAPPPSTAYPFIVATFVSGTDTMTVDGYRIWSNLLWQVEVWNRTAELEAVAIYTQHVDRVLHGARGVVSGAPYTSGTIWSVTREQALMLPPERDGDIVYLRGGGEYRQLVTLAAA